MERRSDSVRRGIPNSFKASALSVEQIMLIAVPAEHPRLKGFLRGGSLLHLASGLSREKGMGAEEGPCIPGPAPLPLSADRDPLCPCLENLADFQYF